MKAEWEGGVKYAITLNSTENQMLEGLSILANLSRSQVFECIWWCGVDQVCADLLDAALVKAKEARRKHGNTSSP